MLRLRPTEITLTPDDVDATCRRIARRQAARAQAGAVPQPSLYSGRPILRRGPRRAVQDSITLLGDIPILRPHPQEAVIIPVRTVEETYNAKSDRDSISAAYPAPLLDTPPYTDDESTAEQHLTPATLTYQLPFRPAQQVVALGDQHSSIAHVSQAAASPGFQAVEPPNVFDSQPSPPFGESNRSSRSRDSPVSPPILRGGRDTSLDYIHAVSRRPATPPIGANCNDAAQMRSVPHTEPRRQPVRQVQLKRSLSSGNIPSESSCDHVPGGECAQNVSSKRCRLFAKTHIVGSKREASSEASTISVTFSYYGSDIPGSRNASSEQAGHRDPQAPHSNTDPPGEDQVNGNSTSEYMRNNTQPSLSNEYLDATSAAARDLASPLEQYSEEYRRLVPAQPHEPQLNPRSQYRLDSHSPILPYSNPGRRSHPPFPNAPPHQGQRHTAYGPLRNQHQQLPHLSPRNPSPLLRSPTRTRAHQRSSENTPTMPESRERAVSPDQNRVHREAYEHLQNAVHALQGVDAGHSRSLRLANPRASVPHPIHQLHTQIQPRFTESSSSPPQYGMPNSPQAFSHRYQSILHDDVVEGSRANAQSRSSSYYSARQYSGESMQRAAARSRRPSIVAAPPSIQIHTARDAPVTSLAFEQGSGRTSRQSRAHRNGPARTIRRIPTWQLDQENSGEGEMELMRREEAAIGFRYAEGGQQDTLNHTPPRMGRVEQRMFQ